jgi:hypothetical protein
MLCIKYVDVTRGDVDGLATVEAEILRLVRHEFEVDPVMSADRKFQAYHTAQWSDALD